MTTEIVKSESLRDIELFATTADQIQPAQTHLIAWCEGQIKEVLEEQKECEENLQIAIKSKWRTVGLRSLLNRISRRITFYEKVRDAVKMGFIIVPDFPVDVFAVRTTKSQPRHQERREYRSSPTVTAESAPQGEGRYVSSIPVEYGFTRKDKDGKDVQYYRTEDFENPQFPVAAVKPQILKATEQTMALKLFDEIGVVGPQRRGRDPIVIGRIKDPRSTQYAQRRVAFFIAWWFDTRDLR